MLKLTDTSTITWFQVEKANQWADTLNADSEDGWVYVVVENAEKTRARIDVYDDENNLVGSF